jgi:hypothetical protein
MDGEEACVGHEVGKGKASWTHLPNGHCYFRLCCINTQYGHARLAILRQLRDVCTEMVWARVRTGVVVAVGRAMGRRTVPSLASFVGGSRMASVETAADIGGGRFAGVAVGSWGFKEGKEEEAGAAAEVDGAGVILESFATTGTRSGGTDLPGALASCVKRQLGRAQAWMSGHGVERKRPSVGNIVRDVEHSPGLGRASRPRQSIRPVRRLPSPPFISALPLTFALCDVVPHQFAVSLSRTTTTSSRQAQWRPPPGAHARAPSSRSKRSSSAWSASILVPSALPLDATDALVSIRTDPQHHIGGLGATTCEPHVTLAVHNN